MSGGEKMGRKVTTLQENMVSVIYKVVTEGMKLVTVHLL